MTQEDIKILITDDHDIVRDGLRLILETEDRFKIIGEACNGEEAYKLAAELKPDVILLDLRMPIMDGITALKHIHRDHPQIAVVILTTYNEDELMHQGLQEGALGFLLKDTDRATLIKTIHTAAGGQALFQPEIIRRAFHSKNQDTQVQQIETNLTDRELEILQSVAQGNRNKEIAYQLGITERTVKAHLASIYNKLGVDSRAGAIAVASKQGLIS